MNRYKEYKDSGIEWIGEIPSHWEIMPIKSQGKLKKGLTFTKADLVEEGKSVISYGQIHSKDNSKSHLTRNLIRYIPERIYKGNESSLVKKGSFIFADTSEDLEGCGNAVYNDSNEEVFAGYHTIIFERYDGTGKYLAYLFQTDAWRSQIRSCVSGVKVYSITQSILSNTSIIFLPLSEQKEIADYLDKKCGEINAAVSKIDKELELLDELKQSEISKAVTKGLNPKVSFKPTGIDWIGEIPSHWKIMPLKRKLKEALMYGANEPAESDDINSPRYIRITDIDANGNLRKETFKSLEYNLAQPYLLEKGDILFVRSGATVGKTFLFNESYPACFAGYLIKAKCDNSLLPEFLYRYTNSGSYENWKNSIFIQSTIQNIGADKYSLLPIPIPPLSEQKEIADYLDKKCAEIDSLKEKLKQKKEKLQELRQSLISEVVTGKRKVI